MRHQAKNSTFTEQDLGEFLAETGKSEDLAHIYFVTLGEAGSRELKRRLRALKNETPSGDEELAALLGVKKLTEKEQKWLEINTLFSYFARRHELLELSIGTEQASQMLRVSKQAIHDRIKENKLIGMVEAGSMRLPIFQFDPAGQNGCVEGLSEVIKEMSGNLLSKISWLTSKNSVFGGEAPIDMLKRGKLDDVLREARATEMA